MRKSSKLILLGLTLFFFFLIVAMAWYYKNAKPTYNYVEFELEHITVNYAYKFDPLNCWQDCPYWRSITFSNSNASKTYVLEHDIVGQNHLIFQKLHSDDASFILIEDLAGCTFFLNTSTLEAFQFNNLPPYETKQNSQIPISSVNREFMPIENCLGILFQDEYIPGDCSIHY